MVGRVNGYTPYCFRSMKDRGNSIYIHWIPLAIRGSREMSWQEAAKETDKKKQDGFL